MRRMFFLLMLSVPFISFAQLQDPVKWSFFSEKISQGTYKIHLTATIQSGWHTYSQATPDGGPIPTAITFSKNPLLSLSGEIKEVGKLEQHHETLFGVDVKQYSNKVDFIQTLKLKGNVKTVAKGSLEFMVCDNKKCLPPKTVEFCVSLK